MVDGALKKCDQSQFRVQKEKMNKSLVIPREDSVKPLKHSYSELDFDVKPDDDGNARYAFISRIS